jgi:hypothetical protein
MKPNIVCHACGKVGHIRPDCPNRPAGVGPSIVEVKQTEVDDLHLEVAAAARMEMGKEADHLGS